MTDNNKKTHLIVTGRGGGGSGEQVQADWNQSDSEQPDYIKNKPTIPAAPVQSDWNEADSSSLAYIANKPTIPAAQVNSDWNANSGVSQILNKPAMTTETLTFTLQGGTTQTLDFYVVPVYSVSISAGSNGSVSVNGVTGNYSESVNAGTTLTIEATGSIGYDFDEWSDGNTTNPRTITVTSNLTLTASFESSSLLPNYFYVEDISGSNNTLSITKSDSGAPTIEVFKSTDAVNWSSMGTTDTNITATIPANSKLYLKATENVWAYDYSNRNYITASGSFNVGGNIMSLLNGDNFENTNFGNIEKQFARLFSGSSTLISASNLVLPNNVTEFCYDGMFYDCSALTTAPALPATTLVKSCYVSMFMDCPLLTAAPVLPATTLADNCYNGMFYNCANLNNVTTYAQDISASTCTFNWLNNVSAQGDFYNLGGATFPTDSASGIPTGWTEHTSL